LFIVVVEGIGLLSNFLSGDIGPKYASLNLPPFSPPGWIFGVVWPVLYALMGIAAYLIRQGGGTAKSRAWFLFWVQLAVNFCWPVIFFRLGLFWAAFVIIVVLDVLVAFTVYLFYKVNTLAAGLMIPYFIWILFASYLNLGTAILN
jgi:tryptophan-rich sensory protein